MKQPSNRICMGLLIAIIGLVYGPSLRNGFIDWDDRPLIVENTAIRSLAPGNVLAMFTPENGETYQPVRVLSYALDYMIWQDNAFGYHLHNTALHIAGTVLLFILLQRILERMGNERNRWLALGAALLFAVHPVNVEAVAWASSRKYGLLLCFSLLALHGFLSYREKRTRSLLAATVLVSVLAALSSPFGIMVPVVVALLDYCLDDKRNPWTVWQRSLALNCCMFAAFVGVALLFRASLMGSDSAVSQFEHEIPVHHALFTLLWTIGDYAMNLVAPWTISALYPPLVVASPLKLKVLVAVALLVSAGFFCVRAWKQGDRLPLFVVGWTVLTWLPSSNVIMVTKADRYLYVPSIGIVVAVLYGLSKLVKPTFLSIGLALGLLSCSVLSCQRARLWGDPIGLWTDCLTKHEDTAIAQFNLGNALQHAKRYEEAAVHYSHCERLQSDYVPMHLSFGILSQRMKQDSEAERHFEQALELGAPDESLQALSLLATHHLERGALDAAAEYFERWGEATGAAAYFRAGKAFGRKGEFSRSLSFFLKAQALSPDWPALDRFLGGAYAMTGDLANAEAAFVRAIQQNPSDSESAVNLEKVRAKSKQN